MQLFYSPEINKMSETFELCEDESKHCIKVMRLKAGDTISITNGKGDLFETEIISDNPKKCLVQIIKHKTENNIRNYKLHIAVAPTKNTDRIEWFVEKATEIGIDEITPIICSNSERNNIKKERLEKVAIAAIKQSLKFTLPKINDPIDFNRFIAKGNHHDKYIAYCENDTDKKILKNIIPLNGNYTIIIGPEGDFSEQEISTAKAKEFKPVSLGEQRFRTETAALVSCMTAFIVNQK